MDKFVMFRTKLIFCDLVQWSNKQLPICPNKSKLLSKNMSMSIADVVAKICL